jgi:hypothetical protein
MCRTNSISSSVVHLAGAIFGVPILTLQKKKKKREEDGI